MDLSSGEESSTEDPVVDRGGSSDEWVRPYFAEYLQIGAQLRYDGSRQGAEAQYFLERLQDLYFWYRCTSAEGVMLAEHCLAGDALTWWLSMKRLVRYLYEGSLWWQFAYAFQDQYIRLGESTETPVSGTSTAPHGRRLRRITGTIEIDGGSARALFDTGATSSYIDEGYVARRGLKTSTLDREIEVTYADGSRSRSSRGCRRCELMIGGTRTETNLVVTRLRQQDVTIGMDWMTAYQAVIHCSSGVIEFHRPGRLISVFRGDPVYV